MHETPTAPARSTLYGIALSSCLLIACAKTTEVDPPDAHCHCDPAGPDAAGPDASSDGAVFDATDPDDDASSSDEEPVEDGGGPDACAACPEREVVGIDFEPVRTRTEADQTIAHMELMGVGFLPDDRGVLVWEKGGRIVHYRQVGDELEQLGEISLPLLYTRSDCGLSAVVPDPEWEDNHYIYTSECISLTHSAIFRYEFDAETYEDVGDTRTLVIEIGDPNAEKGWHNVGSFGFFPDEERTMWILAGDREIPTNAQDLTDDLGDILRILPQPNGGYEPHPDNPFAGPGADPSSMSGPDIYGWGLRNPWRGSIDSRGRILIGDVGSQNEEINVATRPGQNFGWGGRADGPCKSNCSGLTDPFVSWNRSSNHPYRVADPDAKALTTRCAFAGVTYEPTSRDRYYGFLDNAALVSDVCLGYVRALSMDDDAKLTRDEHVGHMTGLTGTAQGPDGYLYATSWGSCETGSQGIGGQLFRIVPRLKSTQQEPDASVSDDPLVEEPLGAFPLLISELGIFDDAALSQPIDRVVRYEPTLPLWTNGSDKERWLLLPPDAKVDNSARDAWAFPTGTLFFKTFSYLNDDGDQQRVETRVIRKTATGYDYHAYAWRASGEDADLLALQHLTLADVYLPPDNTRLRHGIPSGFDCRTCHESNRTIIIGFDELRLNGPRSGETGSQLEALAEADIFTDPLPADPDTVSAPDAPTLEIVSYLQGNCAHCHNDSATTMSPLSLEHPVAIDNIVNVETEGVGQASGIRVVPGSPETSILFQAFSGETDDPNIQAMPPIGVQKIDADAVEMLRAWITALPSP